MGVGEEQKNTLHSQKSFASEKVSLDPSLDKGQHNSVGMFYIIKSPQTYSNPMTS